MKLSYDDVVKIMKDIYDERNKGYGNSFTKLYEELGVVSAITQISHKNSRLVNQYKRMDDKEKMKDTLRDMANYCIMTLMEMGDDNASI